MNDKGKPVALSVHDWGQLSLDAQAIHGAKKTLPGRAMNPRRRCAVALGLGPGSTVRAIRITTLGHGMVLPWFGVAVNPQSEGLLRRSRATKLLRRVRRTPEKEVRRGRLATVLQQEQWMPPRPQEPSRTATTRRLLLFIFSLARFLESVIDDSIPGVNS